ncbi:MAG: hypothetical protein ACI8W8_001431 [Rhodothermales bacterium]|jgi:hypothetical protein
MITTRANSIIILLISCIQLAMAVAGSAANTPTTPPASSVISVDDGNTATKPNYPYDDAVTVSPACHNHLVLVAAAFTYNTRAVEASRLVTYDHALAVALGKHTGVPQLLPRPPPTDAATTNTDFLVAPGSARLSHLRPGHSHAKKDAIMAILDSGDAQSRLLANGIRAGDVRLQFRRLADGTEALYSPGGFSSSGTPTIYVNSRMAFKGARGNHKAAISVVHEGQHYFDDLAGAIRWSNDPLLEARAFLREARFSEAIGGPSYSAFGRIRSRDGNAAAWDDLADMYGFSRNRISW